MEIPQGKGKMNKLDNLLEVLVGRYTANLGLSLEMREQMIKEIAICVKQGYNTKAELIMLVKKQLVA